MATGKERHLILAGKLVENAQIRNLVNAKLAAQPPGYDYGLWNAGPLFPDMLERQPAQHDGICATSLPSSGNHHNALRMFRLTIRRARRIAASATGMRGLSKSKAKSSLIQSISKKRFPAGAVNNPSIVQPFLSQQENHHDTLNAAQAVPFQRRNALQSLQRGPSQRDAMDASEFPYQDDGSQAPTLVSGERSAFHVPRRRRPDQPPLPEPDLSLLRYLARRPAVVASYLPDPKPDIFPHCPSPFSPSD